MKTILLISPYWKEDHRWMVSSVKLAELWQRMGYRVVVACMGSQTKIEELSPTLTVHMRKDIFLHDPLNFGIALGFSRYVRKMIAKEHPDMVIVNKVLFWTSFSVLALRLRGQRVTVLTDALVGMTWFPRGTIPKIIMSIGAWTVGWLVLLAAQRIVFFHPQPPTFLKRLGILKKSRVIPTGIDEAPFAVDRLHRQSPTVNVTYVGRLESVKGVDDFLSAATDVQRDHPQMTIRVAGWYKPGHPLVEQYRKHVQFLGLRHDIPQLLAETDIFVLPSYSEGLSNALMEAMASSCACIASDVGGNQYLIHNGISGFLYPPGDRAALVSHIRRLVRDAPKRLAMAGAARQRIVEHFSWEIVKKMYEDLFKEIHSS